MADPDCLFCKIVAGEVPSQVVDQDDRTVAFMDINPATRGHVLIIPREHATDLLGIGDEDLAACVRAARMLAERITERLNADGVNLLNSCGSAAWRRTGYWPGSRPRRRHHGASATASRVAIAASWSMAQARTCRMVESSASSHFRRAVSRTRSISRATHTKSASASCRS